jgi:ketosteroid isomerase-like protein
MADPVSVMKDFDAAWNAHEVEGVEGVMAFFTDDAIVRPEPPPPDKFGGVYIGKEQIRAGFVEPAMPRFHVESSDHQVAGDRVTFKAKLSGDLYRQMGAELPVEATGEVVFQGDKIKSWVPRF